MGQQWWRHTPDHYREAGSKYLELDETAAVDSRDTEPRHYIFCMKIGVDKRRLKLSEKVARIRFFVTYGDTLVKDWREDIRHSFGDEFISRGIDLAIELKDLSLPIKISVQTVDSHKRVIESMQEDFSFLKAIAANGTLITWEHKQNSVVKIWMIESTISTEENETKKWYSFKIELEYNPVQIPCEDIERVIISSINYLGQSNTISINE